MKRREHPAPAAEQPKPTRNRAWVPGHKGQGSEGFSKGYGGSAGDGTGPSGPEPDCPAADARAKHRVDSNKDDA